jgi:carbon-monoxide dehydrogenase medium subunit
MAPFEFSRPDSLAEAIALLDPEDPDIRPVGGGTAVIQMMKAGVLRPTRLVFLDRLATKHAGISVDTQGNLKVGGLTRLSALEHSAVVKQGWPVLAHALRSLSNVRVRHVATLGGSLAHGDPHMDLPPVLSALGAHAVISGPKGERQVKVEDLYLGYYDTVLARNELISEVMVPAQGNRCAAYSKVTTRSHHDWPALGLAAVLTPNGDGMLENISLVLGAATDRPTRLTSAENLLRGSRAEDHLLKQAGAMAADELDIVGDMHGSADYKKHLLRTYVGRTIREALSQAQQGGAT